MRNLYVITRKMHDEKPWWRLALEPAPVHSSVLSQKTRKVKERKYTYAVKVFCDK